MLGLLAAGLSVQVSAGSFPARYELSSLAEGDGSSGFVINGVNAGDELGISVSAAGDFNGDGLSDLIVGAFLADPNGNADAGESYVLFGRDTGFPPEFELSSLATGDGSTGFVLKGIDAGDLSGQSATRAGDINGDGFDDLIIGAQRADPNGEDSGESYVVFGRAVVSSPEFELSTLAAGDGSTGFALYGAAGDSRTGFSVSAAGDLNNDGIDDFVVGAPDASPNGSDSGESYVVFGRTTGFQAEFELASLAQGDGSEGFVLYGVEAGDLSGRSVSAAGDVNHDGIDDLLIDSFVADPNGFVSGETYVVYGRQSGFPAEVELSSLAAGDGSTGFVLNGIDMGDQSGISIGAAGDVNDDGVDDLIIGASGGDPNGFSSGESYVVFGRKTGFPAEFELSTLATGDGSTGFVLNGSFTSDLAGHSVSSAGDINDDGVGDIIVGAKVATDPFGLSDAGKSYVVFGRATGFPAELELASIYWGDGSMGFVLNGIDDDDFAGWSVSSVGDINGDGVDDIIVGARFADPNGFDDAGESYVIFGRAQFVDADGDGVGDASDNCLGLVNSDQRDTDADGYGNVCDPDLNNDGVVNFLDVSVWLPFYNTSSNGDTDFNGDGVTNFLDFGFIQEFFLQSPGPSGLAGN